MRSLPMAATTSPARGSHPRVVVDPAGLTATHTALANRLAERIGKLSEAEAAGLLAALDLQAP